MYASNKTVWRNSRNCCAVFAIVSRQRLFNYRFYFPAKFAKRSSREDCNNNKYCYWTSQRTKVLITILSNWKERFRMKQQSVLLVQATRIKFRIKNLPVRRYREFRSSYAAASKNEGERIDPNRRRKARLFFTRKLYGCASSGRKEKEEKLIRGHGCKIEWNVNCSRWSNVRWPFLAVYVLCFLCTNVLARSYRDYAAQGCLLCNSRLNWKGGRSARLTPED